MPDPAPTLCRHYGGTAPCQPMCEAMFGTSAHVEPDADSREVAKMLHQQFTALTAEGFTEQQACMILGQIMVAGGIYRALGGDDDD